MYRPGKKEGTPAEKAAEKRKERQMVQQQILMFAGFILILRIVPSVIEFIEN